MLAPLRNTTARRKATGARWTWNGPSTASPHQLFIVQARPETIHSRKATDRVVEYKIDLPIGCNERSLRGIAIGDRVGAGKVRILFSLDGRGGGGDGKDFQQGDVLVTDMTDPDWEPIMKKASAIITNKGGRTCHAAIVAREMGVPAIVGCGNVTDLLDTGMEVTASCCEGDTGIIYNGIIPFREGRDDARRYARVKTPDHAQCSQPGPRLQVRRPAERRRGFGARRVHHQQLHPSASIGAACSTRNSAMWHLSGKISYLIHGYEDEETFFVKTLELRHRQDRRGLLPQQGHRAIFRLQEQRVQEPPGRRTLRAGRGEPDDRLARCKPLLQPCVQGSLRLGMQGHSPCTREDGLEERGGHGALLPHGGRTEAGERRDGRVRFEARHGRSRTVPHGRDSRATSSWPRSSASTSTASPSAATTSPSSHSVWIATARWSHTSTTSATRP